MRDTLPPLTVSDAGEHRAINGIALSKCPNIALHVEVLSTVYSKESNIPPLIFGGLNVYISHCLRARTQFGRHNLRVIISH